MGKPFYVAHTKGFLVSWSFFIVGKTLTAIGINVKSVWP